MSGLIGSIYNQARALNAQSTGLEIAGKNLANVNNANYARQIVNIATTANGSSAVTNIVSTRNSLIDNQILKELMTQGSQDAQLQIASLAQSILGEQVDTSTDQAQSTAAASTGSSSSGLASSLDNFFNAFSALAADPSSDAARQTAVSSAQSLVSQMNYLRNQVTQAQSDVATQIDSQTREVNGLLGNIASLNEQIAKVEVGHPGTALDLRDQRQANLESLSKLMNFTTQASALGQGQIEVLVPAAVGAGSVSLVNGPNVSGGVTYTGTGFTAGSPATAVSITGGSMAGFESVRANTLGGLAQGLDNIANQLVTSVNGAYAGNFFGAATTGAGDIALDGAVTSVTLKTGTATAPGANDIALAIADLASHTFTSTDDIQGTFGSYYNAQVTSVGTQVSDLTTQQENSTLVYNMLSTQRQSASGVSTDEETTAVMVYQRAYQGNARVINIMDSLLELVVNSLGRG